MGKKRLTWLFVLFLVHIGFNGLVFTGGLEAQTVDLKQNTLDKITPTWSRKLGPTRFKPVMGGEAVLDRETGLVWEKSPDATTRNWYQSVTFAYNKVVGGRKGWRVPTAEELATLIDPTQTNPALPAGHPFINVQLDHPYWSGTTIGTNAWHLHLNNGEVASDTNKTTDSEYVWCVRGGHGYDER